MAHFGFDIHGVLDTYKPLLTVCKALLDAGHDVHILTGPHKDLAHKHLEALGAEFGVHYNHLFCIADDLVNQGYVPTGTTELPLFGPEAPWDACKATYCEVNDIVMLMDDSPVYGKHFKPGAYCTYMQVGGRTQRA